VGILKNLEPYSRLFRVFSRDLGVFIYVLSFYISFTNSIAFPSDIRSI
jgi:hypothetical protein